MEMVVAILNVGAGVLELVEDYTGGGNTGTLEKTHKVDHKLT